MGIGCIFAVCSSLTRRNRATRCITANVLLPTTGVFGRPFVNPMLSDRCLYVLSVLSVTFAHCGQTVRRIKVKLGMHVGLGPGHTVLNGDPAPPPSKGHSPSNFQPISFLAKWPDGLRCHLVWRRPRRLCVRWRPSSPSPKLGEAHVYCGQTAGWIKMAARFLTTS